MRKSIAVISEATYAKWIQRCRNGQLSVPIGVASDITPVEKGDLVHISPAKRTSYEVVGKAVEQSGKLTCILLAGGTGGRFFGYDVPEAERIKFLAPILRYKQEDWSPCSARLRYMHQHYPHTTMDIVCGDHNAAYFEQAVLHIADRLGVATNQLHIYAKDSIPRFNPTAADIAAASVFADPENLQDTIRLQQRARKVAAKNGAVGDPFLDANGAIAMHGPGHLFALLTYMLNGRMKADMQAKRGIVMLCSGENLGAMPNHTLLGYLATASCDSLAVVSTRTNDKGVFVRNAGKPILCEKTQLPDSPAAQQAPYTNANTFYYKITALCQLLELTPQQFVRASPADVRRRIQVHILQKLTPLVEIKPVFFSSTDVRYCGQFALPINALTSLFATMHYVWQDRSDCIYDLKTPEDIPAVQSRMRQLMRQR